MNSRFTSSRRNTPSRHPAGFSLIELLTVIAIISILLTVGAVGIGSLTNGKNVTSATTSVEALFAEARTLAISKGTKARVMINEADPTDRDNYLRRVVIVTNDLDPNGQPLTTWSLNSRGYQLPDQVFFSKTFSKKSKSDSSPLDEMTLAESTTVKKPFAGKYYYYEFNSEGICLNAGASFVIGQGVMTSGSPRVTGSSKRNFSGFVIWRNGTTSLFRGPDQIGASTGTTTF